MPQMKFASAERVLVRLGAGAPAGSTVAATAESAANDNPPVSAMGFENIAAPPLISAPRRFVNSPTPTQVLLTSHTMRPPSPNDGILWWQYTSVANQITQLMGIAAIFAQSHPDISANAQNQIAALQAMLPNYYVQQPFTASVYWQALFQTDMGQDSQTQHAVSYTTGVADNDTQTQSFASTLGVSVTATAGVAGLGSLSATLSASMTSTSGTSHSVTLSKAQTLTDTWSWTTPAGKKLSVQLWQLVVQFAAADQTLTQALSPNDALFIGQTLPYDP